MSVTLFDYFAVDLDTSANVGAAPVPLQYKKAAPYLRPLTHGTFEPYRVQRIEIPGARSHAKPLVESGALASVCPPLPRYRPVLEPDIITAGKLSLEQLETVIYAGEQHSQKFQMTVTTKNGEQVTNMLRSGYVLADGTGVGKGRQLAGIIRDNRNQGRRRAVWLSLSDLLITDARCAWTELGGSPSEVIAWNKTPTKEKLDFREGILFGTYGLLRSKSKETVIDPETEQKVVVTQWVRLDQLIEALGSDFDGPIFFDESHALINAAPKQTSDQFYPADASAQGQAALYLQAALPNARIVYVSATAASRVDALAYAERLQLWGEGGAFPSRDIFIKLIGDGGTSALEVVARDLKAQGRMCARSLSYEGVRYQRLVHELDDKQIEQFNNHNRVCRAIQHGFNEELLFLGIGEREPGELEIRGIPGAGVGMRVGQWRGARLYADRQLLMSLKMPTLITFIEQQLAEGKAVVLQLTHTNQAALDRELDKVGEQDSTDDLDLSHREKLIEFLKNRYPTGTYTVSYVEGKKRVTPLVDRNGDEIENAAAVARRDALIKDVRELIYPQPGLDALFKHFGHEKIAEVSGRSKQLIWTTGPDGEMHSEIRVRSSRENRREIDAFLDDEKQILVFTEGAGGVGVRFDSNNRYKNQRPRVHIFFEMSWRAEGAIQGMGRTRGTGEVSPPTYVFASTNIDGEKRFSSTPARKIAALGALTRGQREAADNGLFRAEDNLEGEYGRVALRTLLNDIANNAIPNISRETFYDQTGIDAKRSGYSVSKSKRSPLTIAKFLNRLLTCDIDENGGFQHALMEAFIERMDMAIDEAKAADTFDGGIETFQADHLRILQRTTINVTPMGAKTELLELHVEQLPKRLTWEQICAKRDEYAVHLSKPSHFAQDEAGRLGLYVAVQHRATTEQQLFRVIGPAGERLIEASVALHARALSDAVAEILWQVEYAAVRFKSFTLTAVTGALTPVWMKLPVRNPQVLRAQTDDGERLLMRILPQTERDRIYEQFGLVPLAVAA